MYNVREVSPLSNLEGWAAIKMNWLNIYYSYLFNQSWHIKDYVDIQIIV